ncbi:MAG: hypothetical protein ACOZB0_04545 [Pseudomonadota bacterium]
MIDQVTGLFLSSNIGTGVDFTDTGFVKTKGIVGDGLSLPHNMSSLPSAITFVVGSNKYSGSVHWSLLNEAIANWTGYYGGSSVSVSASVNQVFDGVVHTGASFNDDDGCYNVVVSDTSGTLTGRGYLSDAVSDSHTTMTGFASSRVVLGYAKRNVGDNPAVAEFSHFGVYNRVLSDDEQREMATNPWQIFRVSE